jgi:hypothetical protein
MPSTVVVSNAAGVEPTLTTLISKPCSRSCSAVSTMACPTPRAVSASLS